MCTLSRKIKKTNRPQTPNHNLLMCLVLHSTHKGSQSFLARAVVHPELYSPEHRLPLPLPLSLVGLWGTLSRAATSLGPS